MERHNLQHFRHPVKASPDNGRVSLRQHVGLGVSVQTLQSIFRKFIRVARSSWRNMVCKRSVHLVQPFQDGLLREFVVLLAFISTNFTASVCEGISPERCLIWGAGLNPGTALPVRYFFIQAVSSKGENLTLSPGNLTTDTVCVLQVASR